MGKVNYLVKQTLEFLDGDNNEKVALTIQKNANAAIEQEVAILKANLLTFIAKVESTESNYNRALINGGVSANFDHKKYVESLCYHYNKLQDAKDEESFCRKKITFFTEMLALINKDVE